jgi:hypothetical protein
MNKFLWGLKRGQQWVCIPQATAPLSLPQVVFTLTVADGTTEPILAFKAKDYDKAQDAVVVIKAVRGIAADIRRIP